jgi:hypothetical protein
VEGHRKSIQSLNGIVAKLRARLDQQSDAALRIDPMALGTFAIEQGLNPKAVDAMLNAAELVWRSLMTLLSKHWNRAEPFGGQHSGELQEARSST